MSAAILPAPPAVDDLVRRKRFTREQVNRLLELDFFEGARFELIDGEIIDKMGQDPPHAQAIRKVFAWLFRLFSAERLLIQAPIELTPPDSDWNEPEPDVALLNAPEADYGKRHPRTDELALVVEVSDSSLRQDSIVKRNLFARSAVPEYWVLDVQGRRLIVFREPANGEYKTAIAFAENDVASFEGHSLPVRDILP